MMKTILAVWKNGQIVPTQPVDWPEGTTLAVEPIDESLVTEAREDLFGDDPASIERWLAWFDSLEPLSFTPEEEAAWHTARQERRDWDKSRFEESAERLKGLFE
jgi:predicted DNA-binding antitoxin AbrB/MazE fold protein